MGGRKEKRKGAAIERTHQVLNVAKSVSQAGAQHDLAVHDQRRLAVVRVLYLHEIRNDPASKLVQRDVLEGVLGQPAAAVGAAVDAAVGRRGCGCLLRDIGNAIRDETPWMKASTAGTPYDGAEGCSSASAMPSSCRCDSSSNGVTTCGA